MADKYNNSAYKTKKWEKKKINFDKNRTDNKNLEFIVEVNKIINNNKVDYSENGDCYEPSYAC